MVSRKPTNDSSAIDLTISDVQYQITQEGHVDYIFQVNGPRSISFQIKDRYNSILDFKNAVKK